MARKRRSSDIEPDDYPCGSETTYDILKGFWRESTEEDRVFACLMFHGWSGASAYEVAYKSRAKTRSGLTAMACNRRKQRNIGRMLATLEGAFESGGIGCVTGLAPESMFEAYNYQLKPCRALGQTWEGEEETTKALESGITREEAIGKGMITNKSSKTDGNKRKSID